MPSTAGLHLAAAAKADVDVEAIVRRARQEEVGVCSLLDYGETRLAPRGLLFGYGAIDEAAIGQGLDRLLRVCTT